MNSAGYFADEIKSERSRVSYLQTSPPKQVGDSHFVPL